MHFPAFFVLAGPLVAALSLRPSMPDVDIQISVGSGAVKDKQPCGAIGSPASTLDYPFTLTAFTVSAGKDHPKPFGFESSTMMARAMLGFRTQFKLENNALITNDTNDDGFPTLAVGLSLARTYPPMVALVSGPGTTLPGFAMQAVQKEDGTYVEMTELGKGKA